MDAPISTIKNKEKLLKLNLSVVYVLYVTLAIPRLHVYLNFCAPAIKNINCKNSTPMFTFPHIQIKSTRLLNLNKRGHLMIKDVLK